MKQIMIIILLTTGFFGQCQQAGKPQGQFRIMFYNVENLFDPFDDSLKKDHEFVSGGEMGWTWKKFEKKLKNISKVIVTAGGWYPPEIVAFSEIENRFVLIQLLKRTPLNRFGYGIVHTESPDERGIDVGMIYLKDKFKEVCHHAIIVKSGDSIIKTRNILYVKGCIINPDTRAVIDTLHLFVNHWPSRTGGQASTEWRRRAAALSLKPVIDSITRMVPNASIVLTGDFNDEPNNESICNVLNVESSLEKPGQLLYNLMTPYVGKTNTGTNKYKNQWGVIDQFIVSAAMLNEASNIRVNQAEILAFPFLLEEDEKYGGSKPLRTFNGRRYTGGFSDHLPVLLTLDINHKGTTFRK